MRHIASAAVALILVGALHAQGTTPQASGARAVADSVVAPGVRWRRIVDPAGPWIVNVMSVDIRRCNCDLRHVRARDSLRGRETMSSMVARQPEGAARVLAAINADFFNLQTGEAENNQVIGGEWWKGLRSPDSQFSAFGIVRTQFAVDSRGRPMLDPFMLDGSAFHKGGAFPVHAVNYRARGGSETVTLYTSRFGTTPRDTARNVAEVPLGDAGRRGDTALYVVTAAAFRSGSNVVPANGAILGAYGPRSAVVAGLAPGDTVRVLLRATVASRPGWYAAPQLLIGGWPRILRGGANVAARAPWDEGTISSNAEARHPRSVVGFSRDSSTIYLATVDGRQATSVGMTLVELAELLKAQGVWDALNFDGGGSTALNLRGRTVSSPSDPTGERPVANALLVVAR